MDHVYNIALLERFRSIQTGHALPPVQFTTTLTILSIVYNINVWLHAHKIHSLILQAIVSTLLSVPGYYGDPLNVICTNNCPGNTSVQMFANTNPNVKMCQYICPGGYFRQNMINNRTCVSGCLSNYYIDYVNLICVTTCPNGTYAYLNGSCLFACPNTFYADSTLHICNTVCAGGKFRDSTSNFCVSQCPPGYFGDITGGYICNKICSIVT